MPIEPPIFKLGLKPPRPDAVKLKLGSYFNAANLPTPPILFGKPWLVQAWGMLANDSVGDCVIAGAAHETMLLHAEIDKPVRFDSKGVLADYSAITGYNPNDPNSDQGTDMELAAAYRRKIGMIDADGERHKIDVYADLRVADVSQLALATYLFGIAGVGVTVTQKTMDQFNHGELWDVAIGSKELGGHYIPCVGRNSRGNYLFVTWGRLQAATPAWVRRYMLSGIAYFSRDRINAQGLSPQGYDAAALNSDFAQVTA